MEFEKAKLQAISLEIAVHKVLSNSSTSYEWYPVRNKKKILIEVGGTKGVISAYIPSFNEKGNYILYKNGYFNYAYSISNNGDIAYPSFYGTHELKSKEFVDFLENTNFKKYSPKVEEIEVVEYHTSYSVKL